jgi:hypothetical protein
VSLIIGGNATVQPYALGCTVAILRDREPIGLLLWGGFCDFFELFPKFREGNHI